MIKRIHSSAVPAFLLVIVLGLVVLNVSLYSRNKAYQQANRQLIIQNDSILSINIELNEVLNSNQKQIKASSKKPG